MLPTLWAGPQADVWSPKDPAKQVPQVGTWKSSPELGSDGKCIRGPRLLSRRFRPGVAALLS